MLRETHLLQELDDSLLLVWLYSGQMVKPELKLGPGVLKHPTVLKHLGTGPEKQNRDYVFH